MLTRLLIIFTFIPIMELYVLIEAGQIIGVGRTIALIIATGAAGAWLARSQGLEIIQRIQREASQGQMPAGAVIDGALVLIGGLLLLTPGFVTDLLGFSFLIPFTRILWYRWFSRWLEAQIRQGTITVRRH
ncbi:MAG: membrane protein FxsA [Desulfuromonadales bacterium]|nr:membrane protein FxsA [Desulfuromonadales bacterium]